MIEEKLTILYEEYDRRVLIDGMDGLPLLDRDTNNQKARTSARQWGGVVIKIECRIITWRPMNREIVRQSTYYIAPDRTDPPDPFNDMTWRDLHRKLGSLGRPRSRFDQRKRKG
jgi:hypothetical protein